MDAENVFGNPEGLSFGIWWKKYPSGRLGRCAYERFFAVGQEHLRVAAVRPDSGKMFVPFETIFPKKIYQNLSK
jgi:hypothetical protein